MKIKQIPSAPRYSISDTGIVFGLNGQPLKPWLSNRDEPWSHWVIRLGRGRKRYVHDLVLETFVGPKPEGSCVRHMNGDSRDNRVENLCYGTYSENSYDRVAHGNHHNAVKTTCLRGHEFTDDSTYITTWGGRQCRLCVRHNRALRRAARRGQNNGAPTQSRKKVS